MDNKNRPDKFQIYFNGKLQRELFIYCFDKNAKNEVETYIEQFRHNDKYEVYVNGQLFDIGD